MWLSKYWFMFALAFTWAVETYRRCREKRERIAELRARHPEAYSGDATIKPLLTILEPDRFSEAALERLGEHFEVKSLAETGFLGCDVLWARLRQIDKLEAFTHVRLIASNCTDVSHLPLEECARRGIEVLSLKGIDGLDTVHATAEHTISLMLQALRHRADRSSGRIGRELRGKRIGIIGHGRIGEQLHSVLWTSFGCSMQCCDSSDYCKAWINGVLPTCDIVSIHADLNPTSKGMVNAEFLSKLKPGCILVNTARHAIVDETAIANWLLRDRDAIYAHDFKDEWDFNAVQVISTPHIGGWTIESLHKTEELLAEKVIEWARNHAEQASTVSPVR